jgi:hypothetical protein
MEGIGLHLESAAADLVSNPTIKVSMGTKMPPPPTPPTVPQADPRNPISVTKPSLQLNSNSCTDPKTENYPISKYKKQCKHTHTYIYIV